MELEIFNSRPNLKPAWKLCLLFLVTIYAKSLTSFTEPCEKLKVLNQWYEKEILWSELSRPYNLNIHRSTNILFFSFSVSESSSDLDFRLGHFNLDTKEYLTIPGIKGGCAVAIDQFNDEIYLGGSEGIYKYNMQTRLADYYQEKGKNIWSLFFNINLFYISYPEQKLHIQYFGKFVKVKEFENIEIDQFHISTFNDIYYSNKTGFFRYSNEEMAIEVVSEKMTVRQIVEDNTGLTYVCTNVGVFVSGAKGFKQLINTKNIYGLVFDGDNKLIYSDDKYIVRLKESDAGC